MPDGPTFDRFPEASSALVVGASGGIGGAVATALERAPRFASVLRTARHPSAGEMALDLTDDASIASCAAQIAASVDSLELVVICAGLLHDETLGVTPEKRLKELSRDALHRSFDVNAVGPLLLARALAPLLPRREHCVWATLSARVGSIGDNGLGGWYAYRGAKAAQNMFTRNLAIELGRRHRGLVCVGLHPGTVATGLSAPFRAPEAEGVVTPQQAASNLLAVVEGLEAGDTGSFRAWDGSEIPW
ncbi:MAG: SDR family NAD(P)-dependent oxidoreductase [Pseudomonadales bacterium]|jgi:NAD(P)-dependent dehydrogenase (short-subunit alcohol dehydrogenase family)|nr:SDR family NAD(P)-dependent oxidoreductase [Pseudomonadales bacterium]